MPLTAATSTLRYIPATVIVRGDEIRFVSPSSGILTALFEKPWLRSRFL